MILDSDNTLVVCATIIFFSIVVGISSYNINESNLMSKNIDNAISKGIDPMTVRCAYANKTDMICMAFAASDKEIILQSNVKK
jgi:hypothetical protein